MSVAFLGPVYHWSPAERRASIKDGGLKVGAEPTVCRDFRNPHLSLGFSPSGAWALSGDMDWMSEIEEWDLWQVSIPDNCHVVVRGEFGPVMQEIKVYSNIPSHNLWLVGSRTEDTERVPQ